jgi:hypothetical protein
LPENPALGLKCERHPPWNSQQLNEGDTLRHERASTFRQWLEVYLKASKLFLVSGESMAQEIAVPKVRGTEMRVHAIWTKKREEIARQLGEWATDIRQNFL